MVMLDDTTTDRQSFGEPIQSSLALIPEIETFTQALTRFQFEGKYSFAKNRAAVEENLEICRRDFLRHFSAEEEVVFPYLEEHIPKFCPLTRLFSSEHRILIRLLEDMRQTYERICEPGQPVLARSMLISEFREQAFQFISLLKHHLKEELGKIYCELHKHLKKYEYDALRNRLETRRER